MKEFMPGLRKMFRNLFASQVRRSRKDKNMTLDEMASKLGVSKSYLCKIERHGEIPSCFKIVQMAHILDIDQVTLLDKAKQDKIARFIMEIDKNWDSYYRGKFDQEKCSISWTYVDEINKEDDLPF